MVKAVFFDMNETMLNLSLLQKSFDKSFNDKYVLKYWFSKLLHTSAVFAAMEEYRNFGELAAVVLESLFHESGKELSKETKAEILESFRELPAYDDVPGALEILRKNGIKTVAVSNSSLEMIKEQLGNAGIIDLFDSFYSVDSVKKYKPFREIYHYAAQKEKVSPGEIVMVASHDWDLYGAKRAGLLTAYIERKDEIYNPYYDQADIRDTNMFDLAQNIIRINEEGR